MKQIQITIQRDELMYDIDNIAYYTGRSRHEENNHERVANMQSGEEEAGLMDRFLKKALGEIPPLLSSVQKQTPHCIRTDTDTTGGLPAQFVYTLELNDNFDLNQSRTIAHALHEYLVYSVLADWFSITNPAEMQINYERAKLAALKISQALHRRLKPLRRTPTP